MRIAISSSRKEINSNLNPRFGRCDYYALYDTESKEWNFVTNPAALEGSGAGIKAAQFLIEHKVDVVLTGDVGPKASQVLNSDGIKVYSFPEIPLEEAVERYIGGQNNPIVGATVDAHAGSQSGTDLNQPGKINDLISSGKIAIATDGHEVAQHFGRCPSYTLVEIKEGRVIDKTVISSPGHKPGFLPRFLGERDVTCIIAGGMGPRAVNLFVEQGINTITGITGPVDEVIEACLSGNLVSGISLCEHGHGHGDGHGHDCGGH